MPHPFLYLIMQSSSALFPVALHSAELRGDLAEDVYLLKPGNSPDSSVTLALTRVGLAGQQACRGEPVVLLHGSFSNRRFWLSPRGIGLAAFLARAGLDVWLAEMRGHGLSPRNRTYRHNCVADYVRYDLPAIAAFIHEQNPQPAHWLGHSLGGVILAAALGGHYLKADGLRSAALFGSQISRVYWPLKVPPVEWGGRLLLGRFDYLSGRRFKRGPEDEPIGLVLEALRWHGLFGRFGDSQRDWWAGLADVQLPVLAVAGESDHQGPPWACRKLLEQFAGRQHFLTLGPAAGYRHSYGHVDMLVSQAAREEVWPLVLHWLQEASLPAVTL